MTIFLLVTVLGSNRTFSTLLISRRMDVVRFTLFTQKIASKINCMEENPNMPKILTEEFFFIHTMQFIIFTVIIGRLI